MNEISKFYPIINASYQTREAQGKRQLMTYFLLISLLTLFLILSLAYVYRQMRKISAIREELVNTNACLVKLNGEISETNNLLQSEIYSYRSQTISKRNTSLIPRSLLHLY
mgnify:CR=1 FL=1